MSTPAVKDIRKREIEQSPIKKKIKDSAIYGEDLYAAIANGIKLALKEQQSTLDSVVASTVREAIDSVLTSVLRDLHLDIQTTNDSVKELKAEVEKLANAAKQTRDRVDSVQAAAREDRMTVTNLRIQLEQLTKKIMDIEDRSRRNNVRLVGLPAGAEGSNAADFLRANLSKWIPSMKGCDIEIDRTHCVYDGRKNSDRPHTLIFRVLRWHDRLAILKGAWQAYSVKYTQDNVMLQFFPDFSPATTTKRKSFNPVLKKMTALGLQPFLTYPAVIKLLHKGEQMMFDSPEKDFVTSLPQKTYSAALQIRGKATATISILLAQRRKISDEVCGDSNCPEENNNKMARGTC
uniref:LINE-1 type transposase domain-containing 1 n=1 Tax=Cyprinus carpio TaxID=7962 RepID=A0A8C2FVR2_CYPCA